MLPGWSLSSGCAPASSRWGRRPALRWASSDARSWIVSAATRTASLRRLSHGHEAPHSEWQLHPGPCQPPEGLPQRFIFESISIRKEILNKPEKASSSRSYSWTLKSLGAPTSQVRFVGIAATNLRLIDSWSEAVGKGKLSTAELLGTTFTYRKARIDVPAISKTSSQSLPSPTHPSPSKLWLFHNSSHAHCLLERIPGLQQRCPWVPNGPRRPTRNASQGNQQNFGRRQTCPRSLPNCHHVEPLETAAEIHGSRTMLFVTDVRVLRPMGSSNANWGRSVSPCPPAISWHAYSLVRFHDPMRSLATPPQLCQRILPFLFDENCLASRSCNGRYENNSDFAAAALASNSLNQRSDKLQIFVSMFQFGAVRLSNEADIVVDCWSKWAARSHILNANWVVHSCD